MVNKVTEDEKAVNTVRGYIRVAITTQAKQGASLQAQEEEIREFAAKEFPGSPIVVYADTVSGGMPLDYRPELKKLFADCQQGDTIVVTSLDRLTREFSVYNAATDLSLKPGIGFRSLREGFTAISVLGSADVILVQKVLLAIAEHKRSMITERTAAGRETKKKNGQRYSGIVPYGKKDVNGMLLDDEHEQKGLKLMLRLRAEGDSLRTVGKKLFKAGFLPRTGKEWAYGSVRGIIKAANGE